MSETATSAAGSPTGLEAESSANPGKSEGLAGKYLLFSVRSELFGVNVMQVREIIGLERITAIPHAPDYVRGVINLRGKVIPVLDLRVRFGFDAEDIHARTSTIVVEIGDAGSAMLIGLVVDAVSEVAHLPEDIIEAAPDFADGERRPYISGMAKLNGRVCILLSIEDVLTGGETLDLAAAIDAASAAD